MKNSMTVEIADRHSNTDPNLNMRYQVAKVIYISFAPRGWKWRRIEICNVENNLRNRGGQRKLGGCKEQCGERARTADILDLTSNHEENKVRIEIFQPRM